MFDNRWDNWAGDFADSFAASAFEAATRDRIPEILRYFGDFARRLDPGFPDEVSPSISHDLRSRLLSAKRRPR